MIMFSRRAACLLRGCRQQLLPSAWQQQRPNVHTLR